MLIDKLIHRIRAFRGSFISIACRPQNAAQVDLPSFCEKSGNDGRIGIIIQGGIWEDYNFTIETVRLYKKNYPQAIIIVSTWSDTPDAQLAGIKNQNVELVISEKPQKSISGNCNLQIISTYNAIVLAKSLGCEYVCKTRTDQRMYATDVFCFLTHLQDIFPLPEGITSLNRRIVAVGSNTYRDRVYDINDMWLFGHIDDMLQYWCCDPSLIWDKDCTLTQSQRISEAYICSNFLKCIGHNLLWTVNDSLEVMSKYYIIIDKQSIDLFSIKRINEYMNRQYVASNGLIEVGFKDWINLLK